MTDELQLTLSKSFASSPLQIFREGLLAQLANTPPAWSFIVKIVSDVLRYSSFTAIKWMLK